METSCKFCDNIKGETGRVYGQFITNMCRKRKGIGGNKASYNTYQKGNPES